MYVFDKSVTQKRKARAAASLDKVLSKDDLLLVFSGEPITKPGGLDQTYDFLVHPEYYWLSGLQRPWGVLAYSPSDGWVDFVKATSKEEMVWEGHATTFDAKDISELEPYLAKGKFKRTVLLGQPTPKQILLGNAQSEFLFEVQEALNRERRIKDEAEIALIKKAALAAHAGYKRLDEIIRPGITERQVQLEYEHATLMAGADKFPYNSLVGTGTNASILHAIPSKRVLKEGDIMVVDAGADILDYCVDITRTYPVNGTFTQQQKDIYHLVLKSQVAAIQLCKPKTEWSSIHLAAARILTEGLKELKIFKASVDECMESGATAVFFPHGVGHMMGLRVRDVGGKPNPAPKSYAGARIRVDLPLEENFLMTVEPGLYFIKGLMQDSELREKYQNQINWSEADKWQHFGGVRIEDDILIQASGPMNLTAAIAKRS